MEFEEKLFCQKNQKEYCRHAYLGGALGGVSLVHGDDGQNYIAGAQAWIMVYHLKFFPENASYISGLWEHVSILLHKIL